MAQMPSGELLASIRYQHPSLADDPPDLLQRTGALAANHNIPYKHVFIAHSGDNGMSWSKPRQLATVLGQCYGYGVGLSKNRAIVVTDHRYPREMGGGLCGDAERRRRGNVDADGIFLWRCRGLGQLHWPHRFCAGAVVVSLRQKYGRESLGTLPVKIECICKTHDYNRHFINSRYR